MQTSMQLSGHSSNEISLYTDELTEDCIKENFKKLKACFPKMESGFYIILAGYLKSTGFTNQRLNDAVDILIRTNVYPEIVPGAILGYDKKIKLKTYAEITNEGNKIYPSEPGKMFQFYRKMKKIENGFLYVSVADIEIYNLKIIE